MKLYGSYTPAPVDQGAAEPGVDAHDCSVVDMILVGEDSLAASASRSEGSRTPIVMVKRHADLGIDLTTALIDIRLRMPPAVGTRSLVNF